MRKIVRWNRVVVTGVALGLAALGAAGAAAASAGKATAAPAAPSVSSVAVAPAVPSVPFVPPLPGTPDVRDLPTDPSQVSDTVRAVVAAHFPAVDAAAALPVDAPGATTGIAPGDTPGTRFDGVPSLDTVRVQVTGLAEGLPETATDLLPGVPQVPSADLAQSLPVNTPVFPGRDTVRDSADQAGAAARASTEQLPATAGLPLRAPTVLTDLG